MISTSSIKKLLKEKKPEIIKSCLYSMKESFAADSINTENQARLEKKLTAILNHIIDASESAENAAAAAAEMIRVLSAGTDTGVHAVRLSSVLKSSIYKSIEKSQITHETWSYFEEQINSIIINASEGAEHPDRPGKPAHKILHQNEQNRSREC